MCIKKQLFLLPLLVIVGINVICLIQPLHALQRFNESYDWIQTPPEGSDSVNMVGFFYQWYPEGNLMNAGGGFRCGMREFPAVFLNDSVYLNMILLKTHFEGNITETKGWIKAVKEGDSLCFPKKMALAFTEYDAVEFRMLFGYDTLYNQKDTLFVNSVNIGGDTIIEFKVQGYTAEERRWYVEYMNSELKACYNPHTGLISDPDMDLLINTHNEPYITNKNLNLDMAIKDFIIGCVSQKEPDTLPAPVVKCKRQWFDKDGARIYCNVYLDIFTDEGLILNCNKIFTVFNLEGEPYDDSEKLLQTRNAIDGMSPFRKDVNYIDLGAFNFFKGLEVMCYYEKEDGTRIESPRVKAVDVTGVKDVMADRVVPDIVGDGKVYDLTGREVNPDCLSPGIYIRNGRKFTVTRQ